VSASVLFSTSKHLVDLSIGQYALFCMVGRGQLYAARIISGNEKTANLVWHSGNIYACGETPVSPTFTQAASECFDALEYANLNAASESGVRLWHEHFSNFDTVTDMEAIRSGQSAGRCDYKRKLHFTTTRTTASKLLCTIHSLPSSILWLALRPTHSASSSTST
jgi:hypothetical protein